jgi:hypothetical protein
VLRAAPPAPVGEVEHVTQPNGQQVWEVADILHRLDGPALEWADGTSFWYFDDELHRDDGPAIEWADGSREWHRQRAAAPHRRARYPPQRRSGAVVLRRPAAPHRRWPNRRPRIGERASRFVVFVRVLL